MPRRRAAAAPLLRCLCAGTAPRAASPLPMLRLPRLHNGAWLGDAPRPDPLFEGGRDWLGEGGGTDWNVFHRGTTALFEGHEHCDCFRSPAWPFAPLAPNASLPLPPHMKPRSGLFAKMLHIGIVENRYYRSRGGARRPRSILFGDNGAYAKWYWPFDVLIRAVVGALRPRADWVLYSPGVYERYTELIRAALRATATGAPAARRLLLRGTRKSAQPKPPPFQLPVSRKTVVHQTPAPPSPALLAERAARGYASLVRGIGAVPLFRTPLRPDDADFGTAPGPDWYDRFHARPWVNNMLNCRLLLLLAATAPDARAAMAELMTRHARHRTAARGRRRGKVAGAGATPSVGAARAPDGNAQIPSEEAVQGGSAASGLALRGSLPDDILPPTALAPAPAALIGRWLPTTQPAKEDDEAAAEGSAAPLLGVGCRLRWSPDWRWRRASQSVAAAAAPSNNSNNTDADGGSDAGGGRGTPRWAVLWRRLHVAELRRVAADPAALR
eukprot:gene19694-25231_t